MRHQRIIKRSNYFPGQIGSRLAAVLACSAVLTFAGTATEAQQRFEKSQIGVNGVTAYEHGPLLTYAAQYAFDLDQRILAERVAQAIELIYREDGYFLAEAWVGQDGKTIHVYEGTIDSVSIEGVDAPKFQTLKKIFGPVVGLKSVTQKEFERAVMLADDIPDLAISVELDYPDPNAGARLRVLGEQLPKQAGSVTVDNPPRELGNAISLYFVQEFYSTFSEGDLLRFQAAATGYWDEEDSSSLWGSIVYRTPLSPSGLFGEVFLGNVDARRDLSGSFVRTDIEGLNGVLALGYPVVREVDRYGYGLLEYRYSESETTDPTTAFLSTANNLSATYLYGRTYTDGRTLEVGGSLSVGQRGDDQASGVIDDGDDSFWHLRAGLGYDSPLQTISANTAWRTEIWGQYTSSRLPSVEEFYLGDRYGLRGYRFGEAEGDIGVTGLFEISQAVYPQNGGVQRYSPFAFFDFGYIKNNAPSATETGDLHLASAGAGIDIEFKKNFLFSGYVGVPLVDGPTTPAGNAAAYVSISKAW